jgi:hypothetical protein
MHFNPNTQVDEKTIKHVELRCSSCGDPSSFDGNAGEWCRRCKTDEHLKPRVSFYRLIEDGSGAVSQGSC